MLARMLLVLAFAFVAGVLTILAPCALPVIPLGLGAGSGEKWRSGRTIWSDRLI